MSKTPHTSGQPSPLPPRPRVRIDLNDSRNWMAQGGRIDKSARKEPELDWLAKVMIVLICAFMGSVLIWGIVVLWASTLSMM